VNRPVKKIKTQQNRWTEEEIEIEIEAPITPNTRDADQLSDFNLQGCNTIFNHVRVEARLSASEAARSRTRFEISMPVSSPTKVHSSISSISSSPPSGEAFAVGVGEKGVDETRDFCRANVFAYSRSR
jgi:hypothetical protein